MKKPKEPQAGGQIEPIPFDDALRRMLAAPPAHKVAVKKPAAKPAAKGKKKAR